MSFPKPPFFSKKDGDDVSFLGDQLLRGAKITGTIEIELPRATGNKIVISIDTVPSESEE